MPNLHEDPYPDVYIGGGFSDPARIPPTDSGPEQQAAPEAAPVPDEQADDRPGHMSDRHGRGYGWRKGRLPTALAVMTGIVLAGHSLVPNSVGNPGSLLETLLPWTGLAVPVLLSAALLRRSVPAGVAALLVAAVWAAMFGQLFLGGRPDAEPDLTVVTHNVGAANPDPAGTARTLLAVDPDRRLTHSVHIGTVALWSRYPITDSERVTIDPGWSRSLRARVQGPGGPLAVYVVHLPSVRVGASGFTIARRDQVLTALDHAVDQERQKKVLLMGDLNGATTDRGLASLNSRLTSVQDEAGTGFGFSWPAAFPVARIDHILTRGVTPTEAWTLPATGSDHRPVAARLKA
ncbi:endonuclease/exonuclease/phosphatase family protein [Streptomyces sp. NBC_01744]|uniref:endonuclease/exonuclease/phosphatase family protein n=1 Tax=Streptomyces sp. NBC_01744 TaxID=2975927 RepID=UPI003D9A30F5|nr:endonuclease/exonuclease/phosphatase family protein [Streptomyces sp. NBC_01744]